MKAFVRTALVTGALCLVASPALAASSHSRGDHGKSPHAPSANAVEPGLGAAVEDAKTPGTAPPEPAHVGPSAGLPEKAKAYGRLCQDESKKHVAGTKGTPFSQCVTAMAKLATGETKSPRTACRGLSKKHVAGTKGTPFSRCVSSAAKEKAEHAKEASTP